ncbi:hypothetical protein C482_00235 [Natrialba chahannaoensis JCM 10990]|uniref:Uncharacterized protein n=2 Tax=Natrialba chahannaoensis TaxID=68911 RepID=M0B7F3_9EURY|nr:hypothetical protein C482_00235 [Natrialba chahannaoensis JCM 10990]
MSQYQRSPYNTLWQYHFPFEYWYNRLEKINPHNDADRLEALYSLVKLTEIYSRAFSAAVQNPNHPWYYLDEHVHLGDVDDTFDILWTNGNTAIGRVPQNSDDTTTVDAEDDLSLDKADAITASLLGVPYQIDDTGKVELQESPALHRDICQIILNAFKEQSFLHQSFNQGFCVLPVSPDTVEVTIESFGLLNDENRAQFQSQIDTLKERYNEDQWPMTFAQLGKQATDQGEVSQLRIYQVDVWICYKFAEVVLDALFNLISPGPGIRLQGSLSDVPVENLEKEANFTELIFEVETPIQGQLTRIVTEETFQTQ